MESLEPRSGFGLNELLGAAHAFCCGVAVLPSMPLAKTRCHKTLTGTTNQGAERPRLTASKRTRAQLPGVFAVVGATIRAGSSTNAGTDRFGVAALSLPRQCDA